MRIFQIPFMLFAVTACFPTGGAEKSTSSSSALNYSIGYIVPRAGENTSKAVISRSASSEEWIAAIKPAYEKKFEPLEGGNLFHLAVIVDGYILAPPGVPILFSPKSILAYRVMVIDDSTGKPLNPKPKQISTIEGVSRSTFIGSGLTMTREEQIVNLAQAAAVHTERWLSEQDWFVEAATRPFPEPVEGEKTDGPQS